MSFLIVPCPYSVSAAALRSHIYVHLSCSNKGFSILNSEMGMAPCKLKTMFPVKFLEKGSVSSYTMITAKVFKDMFEGVRRDAKFMVLDNRLDR